MDESTEAQQSPPGRRRGLYCGMVLALGPAALFIPTTELMNHTPTAKYDAVNLSISLLFVISDLCGFFLLLRYIVNTKDSELAAALALFSLPIPLITLWLLINGIVYTLSNL
jgi:hypothetical protein